MKLRVGYEMIYDFPQPTPMIMVLGTHFTRASDVIVPDFLTTTPAVPITPYRDVFGNWCSRIVAPQGRMRLSADGIVRDLGLPDPVVPMRLSTRSRICPPETLVYLLGSRYCETDRLSDIAWKTVRDRRRRAGRGCRRSAISSTTTSRSTTSTPAPPGPRWKPIRRATASAATTPISPSRSAAA